MTEQPQHAGAHASNGQAAQPRQRVLNDRYELGDLIGRGGMADVWRGRDLLLGRDVAVKILRSDLARDPMFQARFRREAKSVAGLNDPNIVAVYDTGDTDVQPADGEAALKVPFIVMEYVSGHTLKDRLRGGPLNEQDAVNATLGVLSALTSSHAQGIVHRDIKPANVMITDTGTVKVMDFGIARALADANATMTQTQAVVGTAQYLSPEQARGESVDGRSDIYSSGCLLFELLTGRTPFVGDSPVAVAYQHVGEAPPAPSSLNPSVSPALDAVVASALAKDREVRFQDATEFSEALRRAQRGEMPTTTLRAADATRTMGEAGAAGAAAGAGLAAAAATTPIGQAQQAPQLPPAAYDQQVEQEAPGTATGLFQGLKEEDAPHKERELRNRRTLTWVMAVLLVAVLAVLGFVGYQFLAQQREANARVEVPAVAGKTLQEAQSILSQAGLTSISDQEVYSDTVKAGVVIDTDPAATAQIKKDAPLTIHVSKGPESVTIPSDLKGKSEDEARTALTELGLTVAAKTTEVEDKDVERGDVVGTDPAGGQEVQVGTEVTLQISKGTAQIPDDLTGKKLTDVQAQLEKLGFTVDASKQVATDIYEEAGTVTAVSPKSGSTQTYGSKVTLTVSNGRVTTPTDLLGLTEDEAKTRLEITDVKGLIISFQPAPDGTTGTPGTVSQVQAGDTIASGDTVTLYIVQQPAQSTDSSADQEQQSQDGTDASQQDGQNN